jgi:hypothetical protein
MLSLPNEQEEEGIWYFETKRERQTNSLYLFE